MLAHNIDQADYALLNAVALVDWQVYMLTPGEVPMEDMMNVPSHGLDADKLFHHFLRLWQRGLVECTGTSFESPLQPDAELLREQFNFADHPDRIIAYRLTHEGGALWEEMTSPNWTLFIRSGSDEDRPDRLWVLGAGDRDRLELLRRSGFGVAPVSGTEKWEELRPWKATYWKTIQVGYELKFEYSYQTECSLDDWKVRHELWGTWDCWRKTFKEVCEEYFTSA